MASGDFSIGVEEEFQLVDPVTRRLDAGVERVIEAAEERTSEDEVSHELQRTQIEIGTPVCRSLDEVRAELVRLRSEVSSAVATRGLVIAAAGTHPSATAADQHITDQPDYRALAERYAQLAREQVVFGCHVHVGVADRELAVGAMNVVRPWLPVLLALSASSPFWAGEDTGYASYRSEVFARWPTAGPPEAFASRAEFDDVVAQLLATESIDDPARIYWDARPSARYDTIEVRAADVCTSVDDALMIAGLCGGLIRRGVESAIAGESPPKVRPEILRAARWRAARFGLSADLVDVVGLRSSPAGEVVGRLVELVTPALEEWGEREHVVSLVERALGRGTSAQRQREVFARRGSLDDVVDWLVSETSGA